MAERLDRETAKAVRRALGTCLVTGGTGFLGSFIVHQLVELVRAEKRSLLAEQKRIFSRVLRSRTRSLMLLLRLPCILTGSGRAALNSP